MNKAIWITMCLFLASRLPCVAGENSSDAWRSKLTGAKTIDDIAGIMASSPIGWPHIMMSHPRTVRAGMAGDSLSNLVTVLHSRIVECEKNEVPSQPTLKKIGAYRQIVATLNSAGGYANYLLADSVELMAASRICAFVVTNPQHWADAEGMLNALQAPRFTDRNLMALLQEEGVTNLPAKSTITGIQDFGIYLTALNTDARILAFSRLPSTSDLIAKPDLAQLIWRMVLMENFIHLRLNGMLEFLARGGGFGQLSSQDIRPFQQVMARSRGTSQQKQKDVPEVYPSDVRGLVEEYGGGYEKSPVYRRVVE